ncbi:MAG: hypothetical protein ACFFBI_00905 [Promethearchaeota archaeon]
MEGVIFTIEFDFYSKTVSFEGKKAKIQIWDFGGKNDLDSYFLNTVGAPIVFFNYKKY